MELKRIADYKEFHEFKIVLSRRGELGVEQFLLELEFLKKIEEPESEPEPIKHFFGGAGAYETFFGGSRSRKSKKIF